MLISLYLFLSVDYALREGWASLFTNLHSQCPAQCLALEYLSFDLNLKKEPYKTSQENEHIRVPTCI